MVGQIVKLVYYYFDSNNSTIMERRIYIGGSKRLNSFFFFWTFERREQCVGGNIVFSFTILRFKDALEKRRVISRNSCTTRADNNCDKMERDGVTPTFSGTDFRISTKIIRSLKMTFRGLNVFVNCSRYSYSLDVFSTKPRSEISWPRVL